MKKSGLIIIAILAIVLIGMNVLVITSQSSIKTTGDDLTIVTAPDQAEAMENEQFTEVVYEPVKIDGTNVAPNGLCTANGYTDVYPATCANDGSVDGASYWEGPTGEDSILTLNLKKAYNIHTIKLGLNPSSLWGKRTQTLSISVSDDGENFTELVASADYEFNPKTGNEVVIDIDDVKTQYVRVTITNNTGAGAGQIAELEVYSND